MSVMSLSEIMDRSVDILKKYIKTIVLFNLAFGSVSFFGIMLFILVGGAVLTVLLTTVFTGETFAETIIFFVLGSSIWIFSIAFYLTSSVGMIRIASQEFLDEKTHVGGAFGASFRSIFRVAGIIFSAIILFIPVAAAIFGVVYLLYLAFENSNAPVEIFGPLEITLIIISVVVFLIIIGVISAYFTLFSFSLHALTIEKKGVIDSLKRSYQLVRGNFFRIFGYTMLFGITVSAISFSLESFFDLIISLIYLIVNFISPQEDFITFITLAMSYIRWPITLLTWLVISPLNIIMITLLYFNLRFKKEGFDLTLRLREIQKNDERIQSNESIKLDDSSKTGI